MAGFLSSGRRGRGGDGCVEEKSSGRDGGAGGDRGAHAGGGCG